MVCMRRCCCCCRVRTGTTVLGTVGMIISVILLILASVSIAKVEWVASKIRGFGQVAGAVEELYGSTEIKDITDDIDMAVMTVSICFIAWPVLNLFSCLLLIKGANDGKPYLLVPWLVVMMLKILPVVGIFIALVDCASTSDSIFTLPATLTGIILGLELYYWVVVLSLFQELRLEIRLGHPIPPVTDVILHSIIQGPSPPYERMPTTPEVANTANTGYAFA